jgi:formate--tetrahydrofolate ligase
VTGGVPLVEVDAGGRDGEHAALRDDLPLREKIETVARRLYRADGVHLSREAAAQLEELTAQGHGKLPVRIAKTPYSLSHASALGANPEGFDLPVREVRLQAGAGHVTVLSGAVVLMPGLPERPAAEDVDVSEDGRIVGLRQGASPM